MQYLFGGYSYFICHPSFVRDFSRKFSNWLHSQPWLTGVLTPDWTFTHLMLLSIYPSTISVYGEEGCGKSDKIIGWLFSQPIVYYFLIG